MADSKKALKIVFTPFALMCASLLCGALGQYFLYTRHAVVPGLALFFAGIACFARADRGDTGPDTAQPGRRTEAALFIAIMAVAIFFRLFRLDEVPAGCFVDEAQNGFDAQGILLGNLPVYVGFSTHNAALYLYLIADMFKLFGAGATQVRAVSAALGILAVPAFYFLLRQTLGVRPALLGAFFLAILRWHVNFSRIGYHASFAVLVFVLVLYFACRAYRERKWGDFIALGIALGISQNTYQAARLIPVWLALAAVYVFIKDKKFFTGNYKKIAAALLIAAALSLPIINYALANPAVFFQRQKEVSIFTKGVIDNSWHYTEKYTPARLFFMNMRDTLLMFNYRGDMIPKNNIPGRPELDFTLGLFAFLGFGFMLLRLKNPVYLFYMSIFWLFIIPGFATIEAPQSLRVIFTLVAVVVFAAVYVLEFFRVMEKSGMGGPVRAIAAGVAAAFILMAGVSNYNLYFREQAHNPFCWHDFATDAWTAGQYYKKLGPGWRAILAIESYKIRTFNMAVSGVNRDDFDRFGIDSSVFPDLSGKKGYTYILTPQYNSIVGPVLRAIYPQGRYIQFNNRYSDKWPLYFAYEVTYEELEKAAREKKANGVMLTRYMTKDRTGRPVSSRPAPAVFLDPDFGTLSYEWDGRIKADTAGEYMFISNSKGRAEVFLDAKKVLESAGSARGPGSARCRIKLGKGFHRLKVLYGQEGMFAGMELRWVPPGGKEELVPYRSLFK